MKRQIISTESELAGYLHDWAWRRFGIDYSPAVSNPYDQVSTTDVRAAIAALEKELRQRFGMHKQH